MESLTRAKSADETPAQASGARVASREQSLGAPRAVPGYVLLSEIGKGGFGEVWLAKDRFTGLKVAIKFFRRGTASRWEDVVREGKVLADLDGDPGIVRYIEVEPEGDTPYYVMTYAEGSSLAARLEGGATLPEAEALRIFREAAEGLATVHVKGISHCDLKPANLLFDRKNRVLLADFGQARLVGEAKGALGTFFYMPPEQAHERDLCPDSRWDVYALGAIACEMLTGKPPHFDTRLRQQIHEMTSLPGGLADALRRYREHLQVSPPPMAQGRWSGVGRDLVTVIARCLAIDPAARYQNAGELLADLRRLESTRRRRPMQIASVVTALILTVTLSGWAVITALNELDEARRNLVTQTRRDNEYLASFVGKVLEVQIVRDFEWIKELARNPELSSALARGDAAAVEAFLRGVQHDTQKLGFSGCNVADREGRIVVAIGRDTAASDADAWTVRRGNPSFDFSYREWFNGVKQYPAATRNHPPLTEPRISRPYRSLAANGDRLDIGPALSAPILDRGNVVGVIAAQISINRIYEWIAKVDEVDDDIFPVLLADGCVVQSHRVFRSGKSDPAYVRDPNINNHPHGADDGECNYCELIRTEGSRSSSDKPFVDPVDRFVTYRSDDDSTYTASSRPMPHLGWHVIIERKYGTVVEPINVMRSGLIRWGIIGLAILVPVEILALAGMFRREKVVESHRHA
jgi:serine/threonine protein kinase